MSRFWAGILGFFVCCLACAALQTIDYDPWKQPERDQYGNEIAIQKNV